MSLEFITTPLWFSVFAGSISIAFVLFYSISVAKLPVFHPVYLISAYHFIGFVVRPFMIINDGYSLVWYRTGVFPDINTLYFTGAIAALGYILISFGSLLFSSRGFGGRSFETVSVVSRAPNRFYLISLVFVVLGLVGNYYAFGGAGMESVQAFETEYDAAGGQTLVGVSGYVLALADFLPILCIVLFCNKKTRSISLLLTTAYIALRFYAGAQRLSFVVVMLGIGIVYLINSRRRFPPVIFVVVMLVVFFVFDVIGSDRFVFRRVLIDGVSVEQIWEDYKLDKAGKPVGATDLAEYDVASSALTVVPERSGWSYGSQYLRLLIWPIPRQLWSSKPVYTSTVNLNEFGFFLAMTHTLYVDAYMVMGILLYIPIMLGFGLYLGWLYRKASSTRSLIYFMAFLIQVIYLKTLLRDGGVTVFYFLLVSLACVYILNKAGGLYLVRSGNES